ncbi:hypothetical protein BDAG_03994 [Burkholderia dolosa AU0158]|nr:hypothetical protein BDAG_03994 [Burkholderia dolosa AU0158]
MMIEDTVFSHLHTLLTHQHSLPVQSCRVSVEMQRPWGRPYRLVEWTMHLDAPARRQIVPAESTDEEIAGKSSRRTCRAGCTATAGCSSDVVVPPRSPI